jgi:hypothetical protein
VISGVVSIHPTRFHRSTVNGGAVLGAVTRPSADYRKASFAAKHLPGFIAANPAATRPSAGSALRQPTGARDARLPGPGRRVDAADAHSAGQVAYPAAARLWVCSPARHRRLNGGSLDGLAAGLVEDLQGEDLAGRLFLSPGALRLGHNHSVSHRVVRRGTRTTRPDGQSCGRPRLNRTQGDALIGLVGHAGRRLFAAYDRETVTITVNRWHCSGN